MGNECCAQNQQKAKYTPPATVIDSKQKAAVAKSEEKSIPNNNWINQISTEAKERKLTANVPIGLKILAGMEGKNDIMGGILCAMWPHMTKMIENEILEEVSKAINISIKYIPAVNMFKFTKADMGSVYPRMRNFQLLDNSGGSVIIQMDLEYDGDCMLEMEVGTSLGSIPLGIKDIKLEGTMRVELKDFVDHAPLISAIVAYFTDPPKLDFDLTKTANIADHPWISNTVRRIVVDGICTQLVDPHRMVVPLAAKCAAKYRWPQPKNVWKITVVEAENLVNADGGMLSFLSGKSDPYVKMFMNSENQAVTPVISDNLNPVWNHETIMRTYRDDVTIQFNLYDSDMSVGGVTVDPDDDLGCATLDLATITDDSFDGWLELKNIAHGKLHVRADRYSPVVDQPGAKTVKGGNKVQMTQIWMNQLQNIDTTTDGYANKKDIYTAKATLSDGTVYDFGAGAYEPHLESNIVSWDMAHHHFGEVSDLTCTLTVALNGSTVSEQTFDMSNSVTEFQCDNISVQSNIDYNTLSARVVVTNFAK